MPKLCICIPQYNRCDQLRFVIKDILSQTYQDFELLIVDDASTDDTALVVGEFSDPRIRYICNERNLGLYPNFNRCIELAKSEFIAIYHNHDRYASNIVELSVNFLNDHPEVGFVHTGTVSSSKDNFQSQNFVRNWPPVSPGHWFINKLIWRWDSPVHQPTVMARRVMYEKISLFDDMTYGAGADVAIWIQMAMFADVGYIPLPLMDITPRTTSDRYGLFSWHDVIGMVKVHKLGFDLLYGKEEPKIIDSKKAALQRFHDRHFLLILLNCLGKNQTSLIQEGLSAIESHCSPSTVWLSQNLVKMRKISGLFWLPSNIYKQAMKLRSRYYSKQGEAIAQNYARKIKKMN